jgi:dTDP-4-amino-4,6-dideoxygalactose transaminase
MKSRIPYNRPFIVGKELYYIAQAVLDGRLSGDGPYTKKCQAWLESQLGCERSFLTHSCTASLEMAAMLCNIQPGDEVIMPSFTFVSTANAFVLRGGVPVFVDIRPDTLNLDERLIEKAITPKTKAIVPVHYAGVSCEMDYIMDCANSHKLWVIEDAAQALLSTSDGRFLGSIGHLGCLSFHETKNIISGEGGALLVNDTHLVQRTEILREKGTNRNQFFRGEVDKYTWVDIGSSYLPSELVGAFLYAQLEQSDKIIAVRKRIFNRYLEKLRPLVENGMIRLPYTRKGSESNGHIFYIITENLETRNKLIEHLRQSNIYAVFHYVPLHTSPAGKKYGRAAGSMKITQGMSDRVLRLPLFFEMKDSEQDRVVMEIKKFYNVRS